jgi:hypothetical protein
MNPTQKDPSKENNAMILTSMALEKLIEEQQNDSSVVIPPFFENISKDFMMNRKLKIFIEKRTNIS